MKNMVLIVFMFFVVGCEKENKTTAWAVVDTHKITMAVAGRLKEKKEVSILDKKIHVLKERIRQLTDKKWKLSKSAQKYCESLRNKKTGSTSLKSSNKPAPVLVVGDSLAGRDEYQGLNDYGVCYKKQKNDNDIYSLTKDIENNLKELKGLESVRKSAVRELHEKANRLVISVVSKYSEDKFDLVLHSKVDPVYNKEGTIVNITAAVIDSIDMSSVDHYK